VTSCTAFLQVLGALGLLCAQSSKNNTPAAPRPQPAPPGPHPTPCHPLLPALNLPAPQPPPQPPQDAPDGYRSPLHHDLLACFVLA